MTINIPLIAIYLNILLVVGLMAAVIVNSVQIVAARASCAEVGMVLADIEDEWYCVRMEGSKRL